MDEAVALADLETADLTSTGRYSPARSKARSLSA